MADTDRDFVSIRLRRAEALVLFEWLAEQDEAIPFSDPSEQKVLWRIEGALESLLPEPFDRNYRQLVAAAREEIRESSENNGVVATWSD